MLRRFILSLGLMLSVQNAQAHELNGTWKGSGLWQTGQALQPITIQSELKVQLSATVLEMSECWEFINAQNQPARECINSRYQVIGENIYQGQRKIGDIFPYRIVIFESNTQVSEQIVLKFSGSQKIQYRYNYSNLDGESENRTVELKNQSF